MTKSKCDHMWLPQAYFSGLLHGQVFGEDGCGNLDDNVSLVVFICGECDEKAYAWGHDLSY